MARAMEPKVATLIDAIEVSASGRSLMVDMQLNEQKLRQVIDLVNQQIGPMLQMMGGL